MKPLSFSQTIGEVLKFYLHIFKHIIGLVVLAAFIQSVLGLIFPDNPTVGLAVSLLNLVVATFFYGWIIRYANSILMDNHETIKDALQVAKKKFLNLMGILGVFVLLALVLGLFGFGMELLGKVLHVESLFALITLAIVVYIFVFLVYSMAIAVIEGSPVLKSIESSIKLVKGHWWRNFGILFVFLVPCMLLSFAISLLHSQGSFVTALLEFIYNIIVYPWVISLILILYHDLTNRHNMEGFKHMVEKSDKP